MASRPKDFHYDNNFRVTPEVQSEFDHHGYVIVRELFSSGELEKVLNFIENNDFLSSRYERKDGEGGKIGMVLWNHPGDDLTGKVARCERVVNTAEQLLGGEVYHYHTKIILKDAKSGGAFLWHQDYGYWYENGCLCPDMLTVYIALDKADRDNGCLKVLRGSHLLGRVDHVPVAGQVAADPQRVEWAAGVLPQDFLELEPGDAAFFHCNMLHRSDSNLSARRRWGFLCAYNKASNNPVIESHHPRYTPLSKVANSALMEADTGVYDKEEKDFFKEHKIDTALDKMRNKIKQQEDAN